MSPTDPKLPVTAYPGLNLGSTSTYAPGPGTHVYQDHVVASLLGQPTVLPSTTSIKPTKNTSSSKPIITVPRLLPSPIHASTPSPYISNTNVLPSVNSLVLARVLRVRPRQVDLGILCVSIPPTAIAATTTATASSYYYDTTSFHVNSDAYPATIRREDIRATEKDKIVCAEMFRVGDVVRGEIISVGDQASYYVSTARNELGVLVAKSELTGQMMAPVSWREFVEVGDEAAGETGGLGGRREARKVAKPF